MRTALQRVAHYTARMQQSLIDPVLTAMSAQQILNFQAYTIEFMPFQTELRNWMNTKGIGPFEYFKWEALNGECYRVWRNSSGPSREFGFVALQTKYVGYGLIRCRHQGDGARGLVRHHPVGGSYGRLQDRSGRPDSAAYTGLRNCIPARGVR